MSELRSRSKCLNLLRLRGTQRGSVPCLNTWEASKGAEDSE